eukprot:CAMPEP_0196571198 /NCGR_PEP_ID=MMETSP1081-20130531/1368_1 /TAXON_ID=36882 /ORGANISM="Pyramimonas amylifera, Strain CCMP720" /LENGTH=479 /DNA_ID=CAMNT_0041888029 /DNA_START=74 /DNA_END=1510 /DNA_ORIENTATION=+
MDRYKKLGVIGAGSFGKVYKVRGNDDGEEYVLKRIALPNDNGEGKLSAFAEVDVLRSLKHHHIVKVFEHFWDEEEQDLCVVMQYCEAGDLYTLVQQRWAAGDRLSEEEVWDYLVQILSALCYLHHEHKIMHRDMKTQNIFVTKVSQGKSKKTLRTLIGDFGLAKKLEETFAMAKTALGTPYYMAPEIMQGHAYDYKSDMWALGCIGYELCARDPAFAGNTFAEVANRILRVDYWPLPKSYSSELRDVITSLLSKAPRNRPSAKDLLYSNAFKGARERYLAEACSDVKLWTAPSGRSPKQNLAALHSLPDAGMRRQVLPSLSPSSSGYAGVASFPGASPTLQPLSMNKFATKPKEVEEKYEDDFEDDYEEDFEVLEEEDYNNKSYGGNSTVLVGQRNARISQLRETCTGSLGTDLFHRLYSFLQERQRAASLIDETDGCVVEDDFDKQQLKSTMRDSVGDRWKDIWSMMEELIFYEVKNW